MLRGHVNHSFSSDSTTQLTAYYEQQNNAEYLDTQNGTTASMNETSTVGEQITKVTPTEDGDGTTKVDGVVRVTAVCGDNNNNNNNNGLDGTGSSVASKCGSGMVPELGQEEDEIKEEEEEEVAGAAAQDKKKITKRTKSKKVKTRKMVGLLELFRFASTNDRLLMLAGTLTSCAHGAAIPVMIIFFGQMINSFIDNGRWQNIIDTVVANITQSCPYFTAVCSNLTQLSLMSCDWCTQNFTAANLTGSALDNIIDWLRHVNGESLADTLEKYRNETSGVTLTSQINVYALYYMYIGIVVIFFGYLQMMCWHRAAYNQSERIRRQLFKAILYQDIGWFDTHEVGELNTRLVDDVDQIENGISEKLALLLQNMSTFVSGYVIGFVYGWKLTLVMLAVTPLLALSGGLMSMRFSSVTKKELTAYAKAGAVAQEVLGAIRTVVAFGGQQKEAQRYAANLVEACKVGMKKGVIAGLAMGSIMFTLYGSYALGFYYGTRLIREAHYTAGEMLTVFFCVLTGAFALGFVTPYFEDFATSRGAAFAIYELIDQHPLIKCSSDEGIKPQRLIGNIEFRDVVFRYPSRPDVKILNGLNLKVNVGQTVALVGSSGCGKSTCVQLIQRFYDLISGQVLIDGIDVREYNVRWLRQHIGVVSQEPVLFGMTIAENIRYGRDDATMEDIIQASKKANAHDFISQLPQKYETLVGERGAQLSGGQKQRIAIARALVRDPTILLLDEATSALDTESEGIVQDALDVARQGRTTIIVAHRLSTIQTADIIAGVVNGQVVEQGNHEELMKKGGVYFTLVTNQKQMQEEGIDEDEELEDKKHDMGRRLSKVHELQRLRSMSVGSQVEKMSLKEKKEEKLPDPPMMRVMKLNSDEWFLILIGCCAAIINGCIQPAFAILFANILGVFSELDPAVQEEKCNFYSGMFAVIGVIAFIAMFIMTWMFSRSGEFLTMRLREMTFSALLKMEIAYFDDHLNSTGALCSRLATDASAVKGATGSRLATLIQSFGSVGFGIVIGFVYSWELTLMVLAFAPFMLMAGFIEMRIMAGTRGERNKKMEAAAKIAVEGIENIRTVATLTKEEMFSENFSKLVAVPYKTNRRKAHYIGLAYSMSQAMVFFANAASFYFGAFLIVEGRLDYESMFKVFSAILFGAMAAGQASSFAPDYGKAKVAAARLFALFDRVPSIDSSSEAGEKLPDIEGAVELQGVKFQYPTRPDVQVLKGLDITVRPGQVVALVGSSGCGKSTVVQLIERFYDPAEGQLLVDDHPIRNLHLQWLRRQIGIVSQEPILFDCSIRENIAYGDNFREVGMDEIMEAARKANIHSFIESLPQGYETNVGDKGAQLSGGQKQRVAIARALVRSPKILLLDEATSALDTESEKVVQEALERAQEGRTSIVIAHRLSTIQNADCIIVIHGGRVAEVGTHSELLARKGIYHRLNTRQQRNNDAS